MEAVFLTHTLLVHILANEDMGTVLYVFDRSSLCSADALNQVACSIVQR